MTAPVCPVAQAGQPEKLGYTVTEACEFTGMSRAFLYRQMKAGELPFRKVRSRTVLLRPDLIAFLENLPVGVVGGAA